jgi:diguanylate cyclase (GGDEF)-like protein
VRFPSWQEQKVQFRTRYLFWFLAMAFFNLSKGVSPAWLTLPQMNAALLVYVGCVTALYIHAGKSHFCPARFRLAMWLDIAIVTIAVVNDPYPMPPSELVFIVVVLGNGMRYGMRIFAEALVGSFVAIILAFYLRFTGHGQELSPGLVFLNLFGGIILVYSYILMGRIEKTHTQLEQQSRLDPLTSVMNRRALFELAAPLFQQAERNQSPLTVMFADLDKFKAINDSFGHSTGDKVLRDFAAILQHAVRSYDLVARLGGDEFVLLLPDATLDLAEPTARRIQQSVRDYAAKKNLNFSVSFGLGEAPRHGTNLADILQRVDMALYQSKTIDGRNGIARVADETPAPRV